MLSRLLIHKVGQTAMACPAYGIFRSDGTNGHDGVNEPPEKMFGDLRATPHMAMFAQIIRTV